jgi:hypothetical protein
MMRVKRDWDDTAFGPDGKIDGELSDWHRKATGLDRLPAAAPSIPKWQARMALYRINKLSGAEIAVMACLIEHAHPDTGLLVASILGLK